MIGDESEGGDCDEVICAVNQESEHNEVVEMKREADSTGKVIQKTTLKRRIFGYHVLFCFQKLQNYSIHSCVNTLKRSNIAVNNIRYSLI